MTVPTREQFMSLCIDHTAAEIAEKCGVGEESVWQWSKRYKCVPKVAAKVGGNLPATLPLRGRLSYYVRLEECA